MHTFTRHLADALLAGLVAIAPAAPADVPREVTDASDPYLHHGAAIAFPAQIGDFRRSRVVEYDAQGADTGVTYETPGSADTLVIILRPASAAVCRGLFESTDKNLTTHDETVTRKDGSAPLLLLPDAAAEQFSATYTFPAWSDGRSVGPELLGHLWAGCTTGGTWMVEYRGVFKPSDEGRAASLAERLFDGIDWTPLTGK